MSKRNSPAAKAARRAQRVSSRPEVADQRLTPSEEMPEPALRPVPIVTNRPAPLPDVTVRPTSSGRTTAWGVHCAACGQVEVACADRDGAARLRRDHEREHWRENRRRAVSLSATR